MTYRNIFETAGRRAGAEDLNRKELKEIADQLNYRALQSIRNVEIKRNAADIRSVSINLTEK